MAKKPFRVADQVTRDDQGRFAQRYRQPAPPQIVQKSHDEGVGVIDLIARPENRAEDHPTPSGRPGVPENPWGPAKPSTSRPPMRIKP